MDIFSQELLKLQKIYKNEKNASICHTSNNLSKDITALATNDYNRQVLVITPKNKLEENPEVNDLPEVGVIGKIKSRIELPNGNVRITIKGIDRVKILSFTNDSHYKEILEASVTKIELPELDEVEKKAALPAGVHGHLSAYDSSP